MIQDMIQDVKLEVFYPHPPERVWKALTNRRALANWMMENNFEPRLGHKFQFYSAPLPGLTIAIHCEVIELEEPTRLVYTWKESPTHQPSLVIWTLTPMEGGTQLRLKHQELSYTVSYTAAIGSMPVHRARERGVTEAQLFLYEPAAEAWAVPAIPSVPAASPTDYDGLSRAILATQLRERWQSYLTQKLPQTLLQYG